MADFILRCYEADDTTEAWQVGTSAAHANPYLHPPEVFAEAEIDLHQGSARIGRLSVRVADPQTGVDQAERFLTALLGDADGYSALNGRRMRLEQATGELVIDGLCAGVTLSDSFAGFRLDIDDVRARGIKVPLFTRTGTATVLPRGVLEGYGQIPGGGWLVPPTVPLAGTYSGNSLNGYVVLDDRPVRDGDEVDPVLALTPAMQRAMRVRSRFENWVLEAVMDQITVLWRAEGSADPWTEVSRISVIGAIGPIFRPAKVRRPDGSLVDVLAVHSVWLSDMAGDGVLPAASERVEVIIRYDGPASEDYPFHFEGTAGELLRNVLRGDYSTDDSGNPIDPRIRYDEDVFVGASALPALNVPVRLRADEPEDDLREWFERSCKALGIAPALNAEGEVAPVSAELPDETVTLPEINDSNAQAIPGWSHPIDGAVTQVALTYPRDYRVPAAVDPNGEDSAGDGLASVEQEITVNPPAASGVQDLLGVQPLKIDGFLFRALGGEDGLPVTGSVTDEAGYAHAQRRGADAIARFALGGQSSFVRVRRADTAGISVGDWVLDARSWAPDYASGERGRNSLAQVVSIRDLNPAWREMRLVDAAPHDNPVAQPTVGTLSEDEPGVVTVPVTDVPAGGEARVDYALSPTLPGNESGLWTLAGRLDADGSVLTPILPAGSVVWARARGEQIGRRPSAWANAETITLAEVPRVVRAYLTLNDDQPVVLGEVNAFALGVRIYYGVHRPADSAGTLTLFQDFDAADGTWELDGVSLRAGEAITIEVEPWTGWDGSAVTGTAGTRHELAGQRPTDVESFRILAVDLTSQTSALRTYTVRFGAAVEEADVHWALFDNPLPDGYLATLYDVANLREVLTEDGDTFTAPQPAEGEILAFAVIPRAASSSGAMPVTGDGWEGIVEGGTAAIDASAEFTRLTSTTERIDLTVTDPRGVVSGVNVYETFKGVTTGPFAATLSGGEYQHTYTLDPDHPLYLRVEVVRSDGNEPLVLHFTADYDEVPGIPSVREVRVLDQTSLYVDAVDTDTASLHYVEVIADVPGAEQDIAPRGSDPRFGAFTLTMAGDEREFRIYGRNAAGDEGEYRLVVLAPYVEIPTIPAQAVMRESVSEDGSTGTLTLTPTDGAELDTVEFATRSGNGAWSGFVEDASAPYEASVTLDPKHVSAIAYRVSLGGVVLQERIVAGFDIGTVANVDDALPAYDRDAGEATVRVKFDTDTAIGTGEAGYRLDGGSETLVDVDANREAEIVVTQSTTAEILFEVRGYNAAGSPGPWFAVTIERHKVQPASFARIISLTAVRQSPGNCGLGTHLTNRITAEFQDAVLGDLWDLLRFEDGVEAATVALNNPVADTEIDDVLTGFEETSLGAPVAVVYRAYLTPAAGGLDAKDSPPLTQEWQACP